MVLSRRPATEIEPSRRHRLPLALLLAACLLSATGFGGGASQTSQVVAAEPAAAGVVTAEPQAMTPDATPGAYYGAWVLIPPVVTIVLAIVLRQVLPALTVGILIAAYMLAWCAAPGAWADVLVGGVRRALEEFLVGALSDGGHVRIILFTLFIGGMVGVIGANGGTAAIVNAVARWASNRRRGQVSTWLAGLLVFFDDYANAMIIGPAMRPVCDRLRISRAKLAYLVDSTAAPVSSIALIGTWIGAEVGFIHSGLVGLEQVPPFLSGFELDEGFAYGAFLKSIPYRFYPILALVMVFLIGWLDRDFGPMRSAERAAATATPETDGGGAAASRPAGPGTQACRSAFWSWQRWPCWSSPVGVPSTPPTPIAAASSWSNVLSAPATPRIRSCTARSPPCWPRCLSRWPHGRYRWPRRSRRPPTSCRACSPR
jgi:hypothetical protein